MSRFGIILGDTSLRTYSPRSSEREVADRRVSETTGANGNRRPRPSLIRLLCQACIMMLASAVGKAVRMSEVVAHHRRACDGFAWAVGAASGRWDAPSPCTDWDARGVLEHVIGFHDVLLLKPLDAKPTRPKDDPVARWSATVEALFSALASPEALDDQRESLLGVLTTEVLLHTWDLSRAVGADVTLDAELCAIGLARAKANEELIAASEMFGPPVAVAEDATSQDKLLGSFGRDPRWTAPPS